MRVFLDTNVLVSAVATRGLCADVVREVLAFHELILSRRVLEEVGRTLRSKFGAPPDAADECIRLLAEDASVVEPAGLPQAGIQDKSDLPILAAACAGRAQVFVTGDAELPAPGCIGEMAILSPRSFWKRLRARGRVGRRRRRT